MTREISSHDIQGLTAAVERLERTMRSVSNHIERTGKTMAAVASALEPKPDNPSELEANPK